MLFGDISDASENQRIDIIGHRVLAHNEVVAFLVEDDGHKADRYMVKLKQRFNGQIVELSRHNDIQNGVIAVRVSRASQGNA